MLFIVATPIGNLEDITLRALRILKEVDYILTEDTRRTNKLLLHFDIKNKMISFHDHNKERKIPSILQDLREGKHIALVSDAGTPCINDPGMVLVKACHESKLPVSPIPGASSVTAALSVAGLPTDSFAFYGFLPKSTKKKIELLDKIIPRNQTAVFFESPYRINKTMKLLTSYDVDVKVARELTKKFEEILGSQEDYPKKGEYVVLVNPN